MNTKYLLLLSLMLTGGILVGYSGQYLAKKIIHKDQTSAVLQKTSAPQFASALCSKNGHPLISSASPKNNLSRLDKALQRYSKMEYTDLVKKIQGTTGWDDLVERFEIPSSLEFDIHSTFICTKIAQEAPRLALDQLNEPEFITTWYILNAWSDRNPEAAMNYCLEKGKEDPEKNSQYYEYYFDFLVQSDPQKVLETALTLSDKGGPIYLPIAEIAEKDPKKLADFSQKLRNSPNWPEWYNRDIAAHLAKSDWDTATQWIDTFPEEKQNDLMAHAIGHLPLEEAEQKLKDLKGISKTSVLREIMFTLSSESDEKALTWLQSHATEEEISHIMKYSSYSIDNPYDPAWHSYVSQMPGGPLKDEILSNMISHYSRTESNNTFMDIQTKDLLSIIDNFQDPEKQNLALQRSTIQKSLYQDPKYIKSWIEKSNLTPEQKKEQLKRCNDYIEQPDKSD